MVSSPSEDESVFDSESTSDESTHVDADQVGAETGSVSLSQSADLLALSPSLVTQRGRNQLEDIIEYFEPDGILLAGLEPDRRAKTMLEQGLGREYQLFCPALERGLSIDLLHGIQLVTVGEVEDLQQLQTMERTQPDPEVETYILSDQLELQTNLTTLETELVGRDAYTEQLQPEALVGSYTHLSTGLPSDYYQNWDGLVVHGGGSDIDEPGKPIPCLTLRGDGTVSTQTLSSDKLGLRAVHQVGGKTAQNLREHGYQSREEIAKATKSELSSVPGIGDKKSETISNSARATTEGKIVRTGGGGSVQISVER